MNGLLICLPLYSIAVLLLGVYVTAGLFVFHTAFVPVLFRYSKGFRRNLIFANFVNWPFFVDYKDPSSVGLNGTRNFDIEYHSQVDNCHIKIGVWHILPKSACDRLKGKLTAENTEDYNKLLDDELRNTKTPVILYCHGNSGSRAAQHRVQLYKFFQKMDFHTIAFDYRGYGDSTRAHPSEPGVVEDSLHVYCWLRNNVQETAPLFVWGHSLGTGISSHLVGNLKELCERYLGKEKRLSMPNGLILESPFNNLADEVAHHPLSKLVQWLPHYDASFVAPFRQATEHSFRSDEHLRTRTGLPVLILHARDDVIVPYVVGEKLYKSIKASRGPTDAEVVLHSYPASAGLGHKWICAAKDLDEVVRKFVTAHQ